ncbi:hypothetical protein ACFXG4_23355 [Nocardia sp. NPDC059246]|uniref:hypothetical protein n=1 Tax=unclassified Nocardia TaxID=2637762 RepID=UPI0036BDAEC9
MTDTEDRHPSKPRRVWWVIGPLLILVAVAAGFGGAWALKPSDIQSAPSVEYWETPAGRQSMETQARTAIVNLVVRKHGTVSNFSQPKYRPLVVIMSAEVTLNGNTGRMWFKSSFGSGSESVMVLGDPEVGLTEDDL